MRDNIDGGISVEFCFRLVKEANMAKDMKTGEPCEAYAKIKMDLAKAPTEEEYGSMHQSFRRSLANWLDIPEEYVVPISFREYVENAWEEDEFRRSSKIDKKECSHEKSDRYCTWIGQLG